MILLLIIIAVAFSKVLPINKHIQVKQTSSCTPSNDNNGNTVYIGNCNFNSLYSISLGIGTPAQTFNFQFDTGSDNLWVQTTSYTTTGFDQSKSNSVSVSGTTFQIDYLQGSMTGYIGSDVASLAHTNISNRCNLIFAFKVVNISLPNSVYGIAGMGFTNITNFLDIAWQNGQIKSNTFTLSLSNYTQQSFMYYDDIPVNITSNTFFIPIYNQSNWSGKVNYFTSDDLDLSQQAADLAIFDSGTTDIFVNNALWNILFTNYFSQYCQLSEGQYICPCPIELGGNLAYPTFAITLDGIQIYLPPSSYFKFNTGTQNLCYYAIYGSNLQQLLFGDLLFHQYNITFNKQSKSVGFQGQNFTHDLNLEENNFFTILQFAFIGVMGIIIFYGLVLMMIYRPCCNTNHYYMEPTEQYNQRAIQIPEIKQMHRLIRDNSNYLPSKNDDYEIQSIVR